jgi:hypothetical protein
MKAVRNKARKPAETPEASMAIDGRRAARHEYVQFLWFHAIEGGKSGIGRTVDLSDGGIGFIVSHSLAQSERVFLVLLTPFGRISAIAKVMHARAEESGSFRIGVRLEVLPPTDKATWAALTEKDEP